MKRNKLNWIGLATILALGLLGRPVIAHAEESCRSDRIVEIKHTSDHGEVLEMEAPEYDSHSRDDSSQAQVWQVDTSDEAKTELWDPGPDHQREGRFGDVTMRAADQFQMEQSLK